MIDDDGIFARARAAIVDGMVAGAARLSGRVGRPIPIVAPDGARHSWFIPITVDERIAGFLQILPDGTPMRYSSFERPGKGLEACPLAQAWTDPETICERAAAKARPGEVVGEPTLTFDGSPDRLAWLVPLRGPDGRTRRILVAGHAVWEQSAAPG